MIRPLPFLLVLSLSTLTACGTVDSGPPEARGETEQVVVVTDSATWNGPVGEAIRETVAQPVPTLPSNQGAFALRFQPLTGRNFSPLKMLPNLMFVGAVDAPGEIGDFLRARIGEANLGAIQSGESAAVNLRENLWANHQLVTIATAASDSALAAQIRQRGDEIREAYEDLARVRTSNEVFARLRQTDLEDALEASRGFRIGVQHDFVQVQDTAATAAGLDGSFTRYRRVLADSWRDFFVFSAAGVETLPTPDQLDAVANGLLEQFAEGVFDSSYVQLDDQRPTTTEPVRLGTHEAQEQRGFWYMTNDVMGGSYIRFAFVEDERLYLYYGMTFAPDRTLDKRKFLRQMEAIGHSLQTPADLVRERTATVES
ncbi:MAG: DUF4837 family protein [Bacteroidota bacterium]